jgi:WD40 repeat protein
MNLNELAIIRPGSPIFAIATSPDEQLLACGGTESMPITIWNLATGTLIARLTGLKYQAQALAFSPDSARLAATNLWGGLRVWQISDGRLLAEKVETRSRRTRSLVYPVSARKSIRPIMLADSIYQPVLRLLAPNGQFLAVREGVVRIMQYKSSTELSRLDWRRYDGVGAGISGLAWSADSTWLAMAGSGWAGLWLPFEPEPHFYVLTLPISETVAGVAVLRQTGRILCAIGSSVAALDLPEAPLLTK